MSKEKQPFRFTKSERNKDLLKCWKRKNEKKKAKAYLDAIEPRIQTWIEYRDHTLSSHKDIRDACEKFYEKLTDIQDFLNEEKEKLYALIGATSTSEEEQRVREAARQLRESSAVLAAAARNAADSISTTSGPDISAECWLVAMLAVLYEEFFQKEPSITPGGNFQCFVSSLSKILGWDLGPAALKTGVGGYAYNFVPPAGATWSKDKDL